MGTVYFGARHEFPFEDRTLNHLRSVIASKLIQHESFALTWEDEGVQRTIWINPQSQLLFELELSSEGLGPIDHAWIAELVEQANTPTGIRISGTAHGS